MLNTSMVLRVTIEVHGSEIKIFDGGSGSHAFGES